MQFNFAQSRVDLMRGVCLPCLLSLVLLPLAGHTAVPISDPNIEAPGGDYDNDGVSNAQEALWGSDPKLPDTDGDGAGDLLDGCPIDPDLKPLRVPDASYLVIDLTTQGLTSDDHPLYLNDSGQIVFRREGESSGTFLWSAGEVAPVYDYLESFASPSGLANDGTVSYTTGGWLAGYWHPGNGTHFLPLPEHENYGVSYASAISDFGQIVGFGSCGEGVAGLRWPSVSSSAIMVGAMHSSSAGSSAIHPKAVNNHGHVIGMTLDAPAKPAICMDTGITVLPHTTPGCQVVGLNNSLEPVIVGRDGPYPVMWIKGANGQWKKKGFGPYNRSTQSNQQLVGEPGAFNDRMEALCQIVSPSLAVGPQIWRNGKIASLNQLASGWRVTLTSDINNYGIVCGGAIALDEHGNDVGEVKPVLLFPAYFEESEPESGFDNFARLKPEHHIKRPWLMVSGDGDRANATKFYGAGANKLPFEVKEGAQTVNPSESGSADPLVISIQGTDNDENAHLEIKGNRMLDLAAFKKKALSVKLWAVTLVNDDEESDIEIGKGEPNAVCIRSSGTIFYTDEAKGDDVRNSASGAITTGPDGICQTTKSGSDTQVIEVGKGKPNSIVVSAGPNGKRNTPVSEGDAVDGETITTGADGIRQSPLVVTRTEPAMLPHVGGLNTYLNEVYGKQMNIVFNVLPIVPVDVAFDVDGGAGHPKVKIDGLLTVYSGPLSSPEEDNLRATAFDREVDINIHLLPCEEFKFTLNPSQPGYGESVIGYADKLNDDDVIHQNPYVGANRDSLSHYYWVIAHEIGHTGSLSHHREIVWDNNSNQQKLDLGLAWISEPLKDEAVERLRLMIGGGRSNMNPKTNRYGALMIKPEWDRFRKYWKERKKW